MLKKGRGFAFLVGKKQLPPPPVDKSAKVGRWAGGLVGGLAGRLVGWSGWSGCLAKGQNLAGWLVGWSNWLAGYK